MSTTKAMYRTILADHFPPEMTITFGDQKLVYRKRTWKIPDPKSGEVIESGLRYGENPDQEAALYELVGGNLALGDCRFIEPGLGLVSALDEDGMLQAGKHPGKINLTDLDNGLNIIKYLEKKPACVILKHNNPCGAAWGESPAEAYDKANMADRIAAFGGAAVFNRPLDKSAAEVISQNYLEQSGRTFKLRSQGMPRLKHPEERGDLFAKVVVQLPQNLTPEEIALFEELADIRGL